MPNKLNALQIEAKLVASPAGLAELSDAVETALASIEGKASVEISTSSGERFTLHIIRKVDDD